MFYSLELLSRRGPLGILWLAATLRGSAAFSRHVGAALLAQQNCVSLCETILQSPVPLSLRLRGVLLAGVVYIHSIHVAAVERSAAATRDRLLSLKQGIADSNSNTRVLGIDLCESSEASNAITLPQIPLSLDEQPDISLFYVNNLIQDSDQFTQILPLIHLRPPASFSRRFYQSDSSESQHRNFRAVDMPLVIDAAVRDAGDGAFPQADLDDRMDENTSVHDQDSADSNSLRRDKYTDMLALDDVPDPVGDLFPANDHFEDWNPIQMDDILPPVEIDVPIELHVSSADAPDEFVPLVAISHPPAKTTRSSMAWDDEETEIPDKLFLSWLRDTSHSTRPGHSMQRARSERSISMARKPALADSLFLQLVGRNVAAAAEFRALGDLMDAAAARTVAPPITGPSDPSDDGNLLDIQAGEIYFFDANERSEQATTPLLPSVRESPHGIQDVLAPLGFSNDPPDEMLSIIRRITVATSASPVIVDMEDPDPDVEHHSPQESSKSSSTSDAMDLTDQNSSKSQPAEPVSNQLTFVALVHHILPKATLRPRQLAARMFYNVLLLVKQHKLRLLQEAPYGPVYVQTLA